MSEERTARLDLGRTERIDLPEAVYCRGKTVDQCVDIIGNLLEAGDDAVIATRVTPEQEEALAVFSPRAGSRHTLTWRHRAGTGWSVAIVTAGTSDLPVADECRLTLEALGHHATAISDVGVVGLDRLTDALAEFEGAQAIVALAGMDGALPTMLAGLLPHPIIAVPTSVGYGSSFEGATALLSMLSSSAPGVTVVGIDNGYGAACAAHRLYGMQRRGNVGR